jgi:cysteine synthase A
MDEARRLRLEAFCERLIEGFGLGFGPAHLEVRWWSDRDEPVLIECNARLAGAAVPALIQATCGLDLAALTIRAFAGQNCALPVPPHCGHFGFLGFVHVVRPGQVDRVEGCVPPLASVHVRRGTRLAPAQDYRSRVGHVIAVGSTPEVAREKLLTSLAAVAVRDEAGVNLVTFHAPVDA